MAETSVESDSMNADFGMTAEEGSDAMDMGITETAPTPTPPTTPGASVDAGAAITTGTKEFTVTGKNFSFSPGNLTVKKGDRVKITFVNDAGTHDLVVDGYEARTQIIKGGARETIEFVADKAGSFEYYCSVGSHRQMGMKGTLIVQ
ncbi:MAG: cupredoxin domain-containing protein [Minisyncoccia bacterium]